MLGLFSVQLMVPRMCSADSALTERVTNPLGNGRSIPCQPHATRTNSSVKLGRIRVPNASRIRSTNLQQWSIDSASTARNTNQFFGKVRSIPRSERVTNSLDKSSAMVGRSRANRMYRGSACRILRQCSLFDSSSVCLGQQIYESGIPLLFKS